MDLSQLSDEELKALYEQQQSVTGPDLSKLSDEELIKLHQSMPAMTKADPRSFKPFESMASLPQNAPKQLIEGAKDLGRGLLGSLGFMSGADPMKMVTELSGKTPSGPYSGAGNWWMENLSQKGLQSNLRDLTGIDLRPQPTEGLEKYRKSGLEFAGSMGPGTAASLLKRLLTGLGAGTAGEAASNVGEGARLPAEIAALIFPGYRSSRIPKEESALKDIVKQVQGELPAAKKKIDDAYNYVGDPEARGMITQGLGRKTQLEDLVNATVGSEHGGDAQTRLANQLSSTLKKGQSVIDDITSVKPMVQPGQAALTSAPVPGQIPKFSAELKARMQEGFRIANKGEGERIPQQAPQRWLSNTFGKEVNGVPDSVRSKLINDIAHNATLRGYDPALAVKEINQLINALEVASHGRAGVGKANVEEAGRIMGSNLMSDFLRAPFIGMTSGSPAAAKLERKYAAQGWERFMEAISDPTKVAYFNQLAQTGKWDRLISTLYTGAMGLTGAHSERPE